MAANPLDPRELGFYFSLAQVGLEMVVPVGVGVFLDNHFGWQPWGVVVGAVLGLFTGLLHLVTIVNRRQDQADEAKGPKQDAP